jgi:uncharacterized membrane protein YdjX (TVP38/TMEM64 family)
MHQKKISPKLLLCICALCFLAVIITVLLLEGDVTIFKRVFFEEHSADELRDTLNDFGVRGYITTSILSMLQVVLTILPAEPIQVLAGIAFGMPLGIACCLLGIALGNTIVFVLYKVFGDKVRNPLGVYSSLVQISTTALRWRLSSGENGKEAAIIWLGRTSLLW